MSSMHPSWENLLRPEFEKPYMQKLKQFLIEELRSKIPIYPPKNLVFNALRLTPFDQVKVVIIGQDPYHGPGQAEGLCFSVPNEVRPPPSLQNIFKELKISPKSGSLTHWAEQGILLLNATLTVREGEPKSHFGQGWELFTDKIVELLAQENRPIVFLLWGRSAIEKCKRVTAPQHLVLTAPHPSPLSAYSGFFGCGHFVKANAFLKKHYNMEIQFEK
jgi:uracil-DNA glycosylase